MTHATPARRHRRVPATVQVEIPRIRYSLRGHTVDVSRSGALMRLGRGIRPGEIVTANFHIGEDDVISISARVSRTPIDGATAIEFFELDEHTQERWDTFVLQAINAHDQHGALVYEPSLSELVYLLEQDLPTDTLHIDLGREIGEEQRIDLIIIHPLNTSRYSLPVITGAYNDGVTDLLVLDNSEALRDEFHAFVDGGFPQLPIDPEWLDALHAWVDSES